MILRFLSTTPALELQSVWRAQAGPGPVENWVTIENETGGELVFSPAILAGAPRLKADKGVTLWRFAKTNVGKGWVGKDAIGPKATFETDSGHIPLVILDVGSVHGAYLGYEWELGGFTLASAPIRWRSRQPSIRSANWSIKGRARHSRFPACITEPIRAMPTMAATASRRGSGITRSHAACTIMRTSRGPRLVWGTADHPARAKRHKATTMRLPPRASSA